MYDTFLPLVLVFGASNAFMQVLPIILLNLMIFGFLIFVKPLKTKADNIIALINLSIITVHFATLLLLHVLDTSISEKLKSLFFGNLMIFMISLSILFNIGVGVWSTALAIGELVSSLKSYYKKAKVQEIDNSSNLKNPNSGIPIKQNTKLRIQGKV